MVNSPNELLWVDGELWEGCRPPWKWVEDDNCNGLYNQHYETPYLFRLLNDVEKRVAKRESAKLVQDFHDKFEFRPTTVAQIDMQIARRKRKKRFPTPDWLPEIPNAQIFREKPELCWWQRLRSMTVTYRLRLEEIAVSKAVEMGQEIQFSLSMHEEVSRGEWD